MAPTLVGLRQRGPRGRGDGSPPLQAMSALPPSQRPCGPVAPALQRAACSMRSGPRPIRPVSSSAWAWRKRGRGDGSPPLHAISAPAHEAGQLVGLGCRLCGGGSARRNPVQIPRSQNPVDPSQREGSLGCRLCGGGSADRNLESVPRWAIGTPARRRQSRRGDGACKGRPGHPARKCPPGSAATWPAPARPDPTRPGPARQRLLWRVGEEGVRVRVRAHFDALRARAAARATAVQHAPSRFGAGGGAATYGPRRRAPLCRSRAYHPTLVGRGSEAEGIAPPRSKR